VKVILASVLVSMGMASPMSGWQPLTMNLTGGNRQRARPEEPLSTYIAPAGGQ
jgi:hypothetical protein